MQTLHDKRLTIRNKAPYQSSPNRSSKLSAKTYILITTMVETMPTADNSNANTMDLPYQAPQATNPASTRTPTTTVAPTPLQHVHQFKNSPPINHLSVRCRTQLTAQCLQQLRQTRSLFPQELHKSNTQCNSQSWHILLILSEQ
ncbi:hypothetical protein MHU86_11810 [Fragilaria crotonensis]|nr:hypothetical protein MHU86_11810 [Fragilaria crotonensis]